MGTIKGMHTTLHCQNWGWTLELRLRFISSFGSGRRFSIEHWPLIVHLFFNLTSAPGRTSNKYPKLRQCRTLASIIARKHYLKPGRPGFFRVVVRAGHSPILADVLVAGKVLGQRCNKIELQQRWAALHSAI